MDIDPDRVGKLAIIAALTSRNEESAFKKIVAAMPGIRMGVTTIAGLRSDINKSFVKTIVNCALQNEVIKSSPGDIHSVIHASLEATRGLFVDSPAETSVKLKVAVATNGQWLAVAAYGESAFHPETNHERMGFGVMHI